MAVVVGSDGVVVGRDDGFEDIEALTGEALEAIKRIYCTFNEAAKNTDEHTTARLCKVTVAASELIVKQTLDRLQ